uniref:Pecanex-like protein n=1 Tax=Mesocestoides corti TaxID=53468 RepID=A0A5K3F7A8_MESCO
ASVGPNHIGSRQFSQSCFCQQSSRCRIPEQKCKQDWYNITGFIDQSQVRSAYQALPIWILRAFYVAHYVPLRIHPCVWLTANLPRRPVKHTKMEYWLSSSWSNMSAPWYVTTVYPSPNR